MLQEFNRIFFCEYNFIPEQKTYFLDIFYRFFSLKTKFLRVFWILFCINSNVGGKAVQPSKAFMLGLSWTVGSVLKSAARPEAESALDGSSQDHQGQPPDTRVFRLFSTVNTNRYHCQFLIYVNLT